MQENNNNKNLVFFLRHGDRGDRSQESYERQKLEKEYDCHLTDLGKFQAQEAGKHIQDMIKKTGKDIKQVKLVASPFLRCCMTAENVAVGLGLPVMNNEIVVDNGVWAKYQRGRIINKKILSHKIK
ncbi:hypothetical protein PPERSA_08853 [Pseudocohnilembus persalinus]|uniref:Histidine phosphatase superfamily n=1 Tax=Pseudocohnilembus persalinus TaxID=266149 RepID=A0A0V0R3T0_PSEPJ|nr:hypothetical protein PPERSA_08853 [Pseudocohnilembus persalinus]|eukprot:KRX09137.1 hypothetical protein PPERSA_08853 [Pseudocohnilembus persalinus]